MIYIFYSILTASALILIKGYRNAKPRAEIYGGSTKVPGSAVSGFSVDQYNSVYYNGNDLYGKYSLNQVGDIVDEGFNLIAKKGTYKVFQIGN